MKFLFKKNYLTQIESSAKGENHLFRKFYVEKDGEMQDVYNDGRWSCGVLVSAVLYLQNSTLEFLKKPRWIQYIHANVGSTTKDMFANGWYEVKELKPGAVLVWDKKLGNDDGNMHNHNGFYVGNDMAISNDSKGTGFPIRHHITYNDTRKIEKILWHPELDAE